MNIKHREIKILIESILATIAFCIYCSLTYTSIYPIILLLLIYPFFNKYERIKKASVIILSILFNVLLLLGKYVVLVDEAPSLMIFWLKNVFAFGGGYFLFSYLISFFFHFLDKKKIINQSKNSSSKKPYFIFLISFISIFICWFLVLLNEYPGVLPPDSLNSFKQIFKETSYSNSNPIVHTLYMQGLYIISGIFTNNANTRIFTMSVIQIIIHSFLYSYVVYYIYKRTKNIIISICMIIFYSVISYNSIGNIALSKDTSFTLATSYLLLSFIKLNENKSYINILLFIVCSIWFCVGRVNGLYAYIISLITGIIIILFRRQTYKIVVLMLISFILALLFKYQVIVPVTYYLNNKNNVSMVKKKEDTALYFDSKTIAIYSPSEIPIQLIANVICHDRQLTEKEIWLIEERCPIEIIKKTYDKFMVDQLGTEIRKNTTDKAFYEIPTIEYYKLFLELFLKYPQDYLEAYCYMTRFYYYPSRSVETNYYKISNNDYGFYKDPITTEKNVNEIRKMLNFQRNIPLIGSLFSPGTIIFIVLMILFYGIYSKNEYVSLFTLFLIGIWLTVILVTPCADEFRYIYPVVGSLPLILICPFIMKGQEV